MGVSGMGCEDTESLAGTSLLSVSFSIDLPILDISCKGNHTIGDL